MTTTSFKKELLSPNYSISHIALIIIMILSCSIKIFSQNTEVGFYFYSGEVSETEDSAYACFSVFNPSADDSTFVEIHLFGGEASLNEDYKLDQIEFIVPVPPKQTYGCFGVDILQDTIVEPHEVIAFRINDVWGGDNAEVIDWPVYGIWILDSEDPDEDGVLGDADNCPNNPNPEQLDLDGDGIGNVCDPENNAQALMEIDNDIYLSRISSGVVLRSANGKCWKIMASNEGELNTIEIVCPE